MLLYFVKFKAVGTIWRAFSKNAQRRQGPELHPLLLLVRTPTTLKLEYRLRGAQPTLADVTDISDMILSETANGCTASYFVTIIWNSVGFVPPLIWGSALLYLRSPKSGCYSISADLSCSSYHKYFCIIFLGPLRLGFCMEVYWYIFNVCPYDCTTIAASWKVGPVDLMLAAPVGWLLTLQLTVLSRSIFVV